MKSDTIQKGRGAQFNPPNRFDRLQYIGKQPSDGKTRYLKTHARTIVNKVDSPDIPLEFSMNPYQGCEHGCIYCYARNTHNYWGYSAGLDFEQRILVKENAPRLLEKTLRNPKWQARPIMLSGNTDCYQPIENQLQITRRMLEVLWRFRHPVGIITKNSLILRDLDLLTQLSSNNLVHVSISITTLDEELRRKMEPRTSTAAKRLETVRKLAAAGIPTGVMFAPVIPGLNDSEMLAVARKAAEAGALSFAYTAVRLNGDVAQIFENWLQQAFPDRAQKVLNQIKSLHDGSLNDSRFGTRMSGTGKLAQLLKDQYRLAVHKYFQGRQKPPYNLELHARFKDPQLKLFT